MWTLFLYKRNKKILGDGRRIPDFTGCYLTATGLRRHREGRVLWRYIVSAAPLRLERALVLSKMTKYEVEKHCNPDLTQGQLERLIRLRGSDFDSLVEHHKRHKDYEQYVLETFKNQGIKTKVLNRLNYADSWVESCDAVFPVGGDGTFLLAASRVRQSTKPVIGFNSDPDNSEGFLCLHRKYSPLVKDVLQQLEQGSFSWMLRTRIRITLSHRDNEPPQQLHDEKIHRVNSSNTATVHPPPPTLPALALNEVFVGESLSAQVSYFELRLPPCGESTKVKSSGLCVSTGTGSTSWHLSMNRITKQEVEQVLKCAGLPTQDYLSIVRKYNRSLLFDPDDSKMCYTIRDLISAGVWPSPPGLSPREFVKSLWIRSHCRDARLVVDGGLCFSFNDGSEALFELFPEDTLRTVVL